MYKQEFTKKLVSYLHSKLIFKIYDMENKQIVKEKETLKFGINYSIALLFVNKTFIDADDYRLNRC